MKLIDTHCHLNFDSFDTDRVEVIERAHEAGVKKMICVGCRLEDARKTLEIVEAFENIFAAIAIHPADIEESFEADFEEIINMASHPKIKAIGETGLDFFRNTNPSAEMQLLSFQKHFELAKKLQKPLVIHSRAARKETLEFLKGLNGYPFVWHCFSEDMDCAEQIFEMGGMISFTGIVTFPKSQEIQEVAQKAPLDRIMVETDSPFLAPVPHRGKRCEPAFVADTAKFISKLRRINSEEFARHISQNSLRFFNL